jgi:hypothetical protein
MTARRIAAKVREYFENRIVASRAPSNGNDRLWLALSRRVHGEPLAVIGSGLGRYEIRDTAHRVAGRDVSAQCAIKATREHMVKKLREPSNDLRGVNRLVVDAIVGVVDLVEAMHYNVAAIQALSRDQGATGRPALPDWCTEASAVQSAS